MWSLALRAAAAEGFALLLAAHRRWTVWLALRLAQMQSLLAAVLQVPLVVQQAFPFSAHRRLMVWLQRVTKLLLMLLAVWPEPM